MRTKQSNTAHYRSSHLERGPSGTQVEEGGRSVTHEASIASGGEALKRISWKVDGGRTLTEDREARSASATAEGDDGLLHDAGNLIGAVALYCDLLSMPHVLRPEHRHYADELRLLGERSAAMIERLMDRRAPETRGDLAFAEKTRRVGGAGLLAGACKSSGRAEGLRTAVERCVGVLERIAQEHVLEVGYGEAAALPVRVPAESVERILINLVRNAAAALGGAPGTIRVGVGLLPGRVEGMTRPWPFQRVLLTVEDDGRGMEREEVEHLLADRPVATRHGIGFRVVRELVEASGGELAVVSQPGWGTRIQMEWPVAQPKDPPLAGAETWSMTGERRRTAWQS